MKTRFSKWDNATIEERFWAKVDRRASDECWNWLTAKFSFGHGMFYIEGKNVPASRIAWKLTYPDETIGELCVCHRCDNPSCCNPSHLFLGTKADNYNDMARKGRRGAAYGDRNGMRTHPEKVLRGADHPFSKNRRYGELNAAAKLTADQVTEIRQLRAQGVKLRTLSDQYRVSETAISRVARGRTWAA